MFLNGLFCTLHGELSMLNWKSLIPLLLTLNEGFPSEGNSTLRPLEGTMGTPSA